MNKYGQLLEHSPFCERDIHGPENLKTHNQKGDFLVKIKREDLIFGYHYANHPFDAIGWDGYLYPFTFSIYDFEPITGRIHQPPPVHQTFETPAFVNVLLFQGFTIIIRSQFPHHTTTAMLILTKCFIMWMAIL